MSVFIRPGTHMAVVAMCEAFPAGWLVGSEAAGVKPAEQIIQQFCTVGAGFLVTLFAPVIHPYHQPDYCLFF